MTVALSLTLSCLLCARVYRPQRLYSREEAHTLRYVLSPCHRAPMAVEEAGCFYHDERPIEQEPEPASVPEPALPPRCAGWPAGRACGRVGTARGPLASGLCQVCRQRRRMATDPAARALQLARQRNWRKRQKGVAA